MSNSCQYDTSRKVNRRKAKRPVPMAPRAAPKYHCPLARAAAQLARAAAQLARAAAHLARAAAHLARAAAPLARVHQHSTRGGAACATLAAAGTSQPVLHGEPIVNCGRHAAGPAQSVSVPAQPESGGRGQWWRSASRWLCVPRVSEGVSCEAAPGAAAPRDPSAATAIGRALATVIGRASRAAACSFSSRRLRPTHWPDPVHLQPCTASSTHRPSVTAPSGAFYH
jgi:hypothetical protein